MIRLPILITTALAAALAAPAWADEAEVDGQAIIVTGTIEGYRAVDTTSGTKTNTAIIDVPQAISVVTAAQLNDQAIRSVSDLVRLLPGVSAGQGEGHRDQITLRGNNSTADFFVDGLRDDVQYFRSFYNIERVEVHRGPNAMVFGRGGGGGLINRITKGAVIGETQAGLTLSGDTFGSWYGAVDGNIALGNMAGLRVNAFYEDLNNHRDGFGGERYGVNPTIGAQLGETARVQFGYEYAQDARVVDRGIPSAFAGSITSPAGPLAGARDMFFGVKGVSDSDFEAHVVRFRGEAELTSALKFSTQALYGDYDKSYTNVFAATAVTTPTSGPLAGIRSVGIEAYRDPTTRQNLITQANLEWRGRTGGVEHVLLFGGEYTDQQTANERINGFFSPNPPLTSSANRRTLAALADPLSVPAITFTAGAGGNSNRKVAATLSQWSAYLQDHISFSDHIDLIAGIRYDRLKISVTNQFTSASVVRTDDLWSPRVGLVVKPVEAASLYISWSRSFLPQSGDQFLTFDATNANLEPETFDNYEVGAKWDIKPGLSLTTAVYRLDRGNTRAIGPVPGTVVLTGEQRTSGFEFSLVGKLTKRWHTALGYARTRAVITRSTSAAPANRPLAQVPKHQVSLWNRYDVTDRFGLGLGLYYQSGQFASISNATRLPGYTRLDAALFYKLSDRFEVQMNIENLTNARYFSSAHNDNNISPGAPINARLTVTAKL